MSICYLSNLQKQLTEFTECCQFLQVHSNLLNWFLQDQRKLCLANVFSFGEITLAKKKKKEHKKVPSFFNV